MLFDGHCDIWTDIAARRLDYNETDVFRHRHLEKFRAGGVTGGVFVVWIDPPRDVDPAKRAREIIACRDAEMQEASDLIHIVTKYEDFAVAEKLGKLAVVNGLEGLSQIGSNLDLLDQYYEEGNFRHAILTWNNYNDLATGWTEDPERGLTEIGAQAVRRIQDLGMVMDVSHLNDKSFWGVMDVAQGPVVASHSNCRALCPIGRDLSDEMIKEIAQTGGIIGMNSFGGLISLDEELQTVEHLADHAEHIVDLVGIDHVAIGYDFDEYLGKEALASFSDNLEEPSAKGIGNEADAQNLIKVLASRGYDQEGLDKIAYKNFYRIFKEVWK